ncbi:MAG: hypothetical protein IJN45_03315 [Alistipes sp.]|nr:hypothetical protein [Alistipes sp.]MBQ6988159.1 hypothetical protein [Alistipes sp.]
MASWIKIFRELLQWEWFEKAEMVQLFIYLLLKASCEDKQWQGITVKRGQLVTSNGSMRRDLKLSEQQIRTCIKRLISTGEITYQSTNRYVIITICNYDKYQENKSTANEPINEQANTLPTDEQRAINEQTTTSKEIKNIRNKEISISEDIDTKKSRKAASPSASAEAQAEEPAEKIPFAEIKNLWNSTCTGFARLVVISDNRRNKIRNRVAEMGGVEKALPIIKTIFEKAQASSFLKGDNKRGWKASFDWFFENDKNWVKVFEGNYDEKPAGTPQARQYKPKDDVNDLWK